MPKSLTTLDSHTADIVAERRKTKDARFKALPAGIERVEDVVRHAIDYLAEHLAPLGFKAAPSKLTLSRKAGETTQVIALRTDAGNLSGVSVRVSVEALVRSPSLKRWTAEHGTKYAREHLWAKQLGYLSGHHEYLKWQLIDPATREQELSDLLSRIQSLALPVFAAWSERDAIRRALFRRTEVDRLDWLMEMALWCGDAAAASGLAEQHIRIRPQDKSEFLSELARFQVDRSIREPGHSPMSGAAFLAARFELEIGP